MINPDQAIEARLLEMNQRINQYSADIEDSFEKHEWDRLSNVLSERQTYLEAILENTENKSLRPDLEKLVADILKQDQMALSKLQEQKNKLIELRLLFERGMRANKAYGGG